MSYDNSFNMPSSSNNFHGYLGDADSNLGGFDSNQDFSFAPPAQTENQDYSVNNGHVGSWLDEFLSYDSQETPFDNPTSSLMSTSQSALLTTSSPSPSSATFTTSPSAFGHNSSPASNLDMSFSSATTPDMSYIPFASPPAPSRQQFRPSELSAYQNNRYDNSFADYDNAATQNEFVPPRENANLFREDGSDQEAFAEIGSPDAAISGGRSGFQISQSTSTPMIGTVRLTLPTIPQQQPSAKQTVKSVSQQTLGNYGHGNSGMAGSYHSPYAPQQISAQRNVNPQAQRAHVDYGRVKSASNLNFLAENSHTSGFGQNIGNSMHQAPRVSATVHQLQMNEDNGYYVDNNMNSDYQQNVANQTIQQAQVHVGVVNTGFNGIRDNVQTAQPRVSTQLAARVSAQREPVNRAAVVAPGNPATSANGSQQRPVQRRNVSTPAPRQNTPVTSTVTPQTQQTPVRRQNIATPAARKNTFKPVPLVPVRASLEGKRLRYGGLGNPVEAVAIDTPDSPVSGGYTSTRQSQQYSGLSRDSGSSQGAAMNMRNTLPSNVRNPTQATPRRPQHQRAISTVGYKHHVPNMSFVDGSDEEEENSNTAPAQPARATPAPNRKRSRAESSADALQPIKKLVTGLEFNPATELPHSLPVSENDEDLGQFMLGYLQGMKKAHQLEMEPTKFKSGITLDNQIFEYMAPAEDDNLGPVPPFTVPAFNLGPTDSYVRAHKSIIGEDNGCFVTLYPPGFEGIQEIMWFAKMDAEVWDEAWQKGSTAGIAGCGAIMYQDEDY